MAWLKPVRNQSAGIFYIQYMIYEWNITTGGGYLQFLKSKQVIEINLYFQLKFSAWIVSFLSFWAWSCEFLYQTGRFEFLCMIIVHTTLIFHILLNLLYILQLKITDHMAKS